MCEAQIENTTTGMWACVCLSVYLCVHSFILVADLILSHGLLQTPEHGYDRHTML